MTLENPDLLSMYETMFKIRTFESKASELFADSLIPGFVHLYLGEEAIAAGVCANLTTRDFITSTHRGHGHVIAKGADLNKMMAELFGKQDGYCKGKGGSMHIADVEIGILGANGIVGGGQPIATGAALACKMKKTGGVAVCFFGDGASNRGTFHESVNMASAWTLPALYVIENNGFGISCSIEKASNVTDLSVRATAYGIPGVTVDGNDVLAVQEASAELIERARKGEGPAILECKTWRHHGHFEGDPGEYKPLDKQEEWLSKDPLPRFRNYLLETAKLDEGTVKALEEKVVAMVDASVEFAVNSPEPDIESLNDHVYA
ncbi:pyruvate dehydrogenase E1 component subunit alpha [Desulfoluna limicola]|uniref:Pyruvate dehydrogenase E1 component subunit alpha n=1 Tax=Desulfoluna limicola TaxID=2810562 RepID=A0ABN6F1C8_9BACT|nr:thiamine pyrophosphate-dependent dehydrogenase E1 component subunit alpha [Desulfoluna limicola]BCS95748.1 pyruvate dehydrogenase E1 component subunit alpha [Desulfoluna limicola]